KLCNYSIPGPVLDPYGRPQKAKAPADLVFQKPLIREVQLYVAVGKKDKRGRGHSRLGHVVDAHAARTGDRGALEIYVLQEPVHLTRSNALVPFGGDLFERGKNLVDARALSG